MTTAQQQDGRPAPLLWSIQYLRAAAAIAVLLFHLQIFPTGGAGIDLFFVISGLVMGLVGVREQPRAFLVRRIARVVPLYWLATVAFAALELLRGGGHAAGITPATLILSLLFIPFRDFHGQAWPVYVPGWTLNLEMMFYALFSIALCGRHPRGRLIVALLGLALLGALAQFTDPRLATWTSPMLLEFAGGLALSIVLPRIGPRAAWAMTLGGVLFYAMVLPTPMLLRLPLPNSVAGFGLPAVLLVGGLAALERHGFAIRSVWLKQLGDASYALYLTHLFTLMVMSRLVPQDTLPGSAINIAACLAVAIATHRWIERPATRAARRLLTRQKAPAG